MMTEKKVCEKTARVLFTKIFVLHKLTISNPTFFIYKLASDAEKESIKRSPLKKKLFVVAQRIKCTCFNLFLHEPILSCAFKTLISDHKWNPTLPNYIFLWYFWFFQKSITNLVLNIVFCFKKNCLSTISIEKLQT